jgi:hypothetical protein
MPVETRAEYSAAGDFQQMLSFLLTGAQRSMAERGLKPRSSPVQSSPPRNGIACGQKPPASPQSADENRVPAWSSGPTISAMCSATVRPENSNSPQKAPMISDRSARLAAGGRAAARLPVAVFA